MRRRLTLLVAATMCLALLAFVVPLALLLRTVAQDRATTTAGADAQSLVPLVGTADPVSLRTSVEHMAADSRAPLTVFLADGSVLGTRAPRTSAVRLAALAGVSRTVERPDGREIVVAVLGRPDGTAVIRAFVPAAELTRGVARAWLVLAGLGVALLLLGLLVADRLSRALVSPITELSTVSHRLARADLTARARPDGPPELREVAGALNHLADRIQELLREEREQVADLSHRLRAPLTSLRLEAESLAGPDAARIGARVDAMERAVTGLISQARHRREPDAHAVCEATSAVRERVAFWTVLAEDTGRAVTLDITADGTASGTAGGTADGTAGGTLPVGVPADELAAAVDALLGNVFAHTPDGTAFSVTLAPRTGGGAVLTVADDGPGLSTDLVQRGASLGGSTGLGLDIARRVARSSGGRMDLSTGPDGGARVTLELGPPASPPALP
ncbi:signal transduction histidine kinase [Streptomyces umbrinus]|uniref:sensor histidine kinase n=1 Tax=Streptomyces umbrinus TaxID=67370 RepID=UPI00167C6543|nr:HAMP domain-containing sensor histidine kinase [Streptomyces umbrinus]MCR3726675.1 signal transduction histidine kinase [Streptomyces umbrinus]GHH33690.1 two-component sensor histidine kinase [Streptomyces umbrinus]